MKIADCFAKFQPHAGALRCPMCEENFVAERPGSLRCANGHCFDLAAKGYVNFVPARKKDDYSADLFAHRQQIYGLGFYRPVLDAVAEQLQKHFGDAHICLLDAGCGEGYYASGLLDKLSGAVIFAADVSAHAIKQADTKNGVLWMVADSARLPLKAHSQNAVLNVLAPANYEQFARVLSADGLLLKLIPGENYLAELRQACAGQLQKEKYSNEEVVAHFEKHFTLLERIRLKYTQQTEAHTLEAFAQMTPMTRSINLESIDLSGINGVTIDIEILVGQPRRKEEK